MAEIYCWEVLEHEDAVTKRATNAVISAASVPSDRMCVCLGMTISPK